jgi:hypothetical protein
MVKFLHSLRANFCFLFLGLLALAASPNALGQNADFFLQVSRQLPAGIDPGDSASANLTLGTTNGFASPVTLSCVTVPAETPDPCTVSPSTATPPSSPSLTFDSAGLQPNTYTVTVTGVSGADTASVTLTPISVLAVTPQYTLAVGTALSPSSVHAGSGATAVINISSTDGYSGSVTPGCSAITPLTEPSPVCSFNPSTVTVTNGVIATTTLTISTAGTTTNGTGTASSRAHSRWIYASFLPLPFIVAAGAWGDGKLRRKLLSLLGLLIIAVGLFSLPACNASTTVNNGATTPNNTYTFTISAYDENGVAPTGTTGTTGTIVTVSLTVD